MIRFEDTLYHYELVMDAINRCVGYPTAQENGVQYRYRVQRAKSHGKSTDFVTALRSYATSSGRTRGLAPDDFPYMRKALDPALIQLFSYPATP